MELSLEKFLIDFVDSVQPSIVVYIGLTFFRSSTLLGYSVVLSPSISYSVQILIFSQLSRVSKRVKISASNPLIFAVYLPATPSNHPILLALPVVTPNSPALFLISSPFLPNISVGKGPSPTLVQYAL